MTDASTDDDIDLLDQLGVDTEPSKEQEHTHRQQRIIAGFEEIVAFVEAYNRLPQHSDGADIFERIYAARLDSIRASQECREVLQGRDSRGLLSDTYTVTDPALALREDSATDEEMLSALGIADGDADSITHLKHIRSRAEVHAAEEVAQRMPCRDFGIFKPLFLQIQNDLQSGIRRTLRFQDNAEVKKGDFFILDGQKVFVAEMGDRFVNRYNRPDCRLRVIFDNGVESALLLRSLQRALNRDKTSRRITEPSLGPLFSDTEEDDDADVGHIYILRSKSEVPFIVENRSIIHKIGVTSGSVEKRIANAEKDPTFLLAPVEIVQSYRLANINPVSLERVLHQYFAAARLDLALNDRFGFGVEPKEWFLLALPVIEDAVQLLVDGKLDEYEYNRATGENRRIPQS